MNEQSIFVEALARESESERQAFLEDACSDPALRARVRRLLSHHDRAGHFLEESNAVVRDELFGSTGPFEGVGQCIGPYELLEQIGEGGMGVVYLAAQQTPVRRKVALKIIKPGMDTKQVIGRFEAERQALALMDHPNIAYVLDAGATESGRPYFVMELVRGVPLTEYCQRENPSLEQRLDLFVDVCHAVQHAHLKGIIHRDIKPSNVMVTLYDGTPVVKIIDFGVAKAMNQQLTERTLFTNYAQMLGTPLYMSPEQAEMSGLDVDTRSDIYSLGVLLYELLTGSTPFAPQRLRDADYDEMRRIIKEEDPPRPSSRISTIQHASETISDQRRLELVQLSHALQGDLDWIVLKAIEKDRGRRYQSAREFAEDVLRYLRGEAVEARPPSFQYRFGKLLARHRGLAISLTALTALLILATAVSTTFAVRARNAEQQAKSARQRAEVEAAIATRISSFLSEELLSHASPYVTPNRSLTLREVLDRAAERVEGHFADQPLVEAKIRTTIGTTYQHLGRYREAERHLLRGSLLRRQVLGDDHPDTLRSEYELAITETHLHGAKTALPRWQQTLARQRIILGDEHPNTLLSLGWQAYALALDRQFDAAKSLYDEANEAFERVLGPEHPETLDCLDGMARMLNYQGRHREAEALHKRLLDTRRRVLGQDHPQFLDSLSAMADIYMVRGKAAEAVALYQQVVETRRRVMGDEHPVTLMESREMGRALESSYQLQAAEDVYLQTLATEQEFFGPDDERTLWTMRRLASLYVTRGKHEEAAELFRTVLESRRKSLGNEHEFTLSGCRRLAWPLLLLKQYDEAFALHNEVVGTLTRLYGPDDARTVRATIRQFHCLQEAGRLDEAQQIGELLLERQSQLRGRDHEDTLAVMLQLAYTTKKSRLLKRAEALFREVRDRRAAIYGTKDPVALKAGNQLAVVLRFQGRLEEAETVVREVLEVRKRVFGEMHFDVYESVDDLSYILEAQGRLAEAAEQLDQVIRIRRTISGDSHPLTLDALARLDHLAERLEEAADWTSASQARENAWRHYTEVLGETNAQSVLNLTLAASDLEKAEPVDREKVRSLRSRELELRKTPVVQP